MIKRFICVWMAVLLASACACFPALASESDYDSSHPENLNDTDLNASAAILIEAESGMVVYEKNADVRMYPASTTKILTTYLAILLGDLEQTVTTSSTALQLEEGASTIPLTDGEQLPLENLLYATMVKSGNDGANVIAESISGSIYGFAQTMNQYAASIGCTGSNFVNPSGLHDDNHYTTARDMALIAREAMQDETFRNIVSTTTYALPATNMHGSRRLDSRMAELFGSENAVYPYANGIKTGYTSKAGYCFVGSATKNGVTFISVVFKCGSYAKCWSDTKKLMEYGFSQYVSTSVAELYAMNPKVLEISRYDLDDPQLGQLELSLNKLSNSTNDSIVTLRSRLDYLSSNFNDLVAIEYVHDPVAPIEAGEVMANLTYYPEEGEPIEYELVASRSVARRVLDFPSLDELIEETLNDPNPFPRFTVEIFLFLVAVVALIWGLVKGIKRIMGFRSRKPRRKAIKPISRYYR